MAVNAQYTKDLSFEAPAAPGVFMQMQKEAPDINVNIDVRAQPFQQKNVYEVTLHIRAECKVGDTTGFMLELQYAGLFTLNIPENQVQPMVMIECPRFLFPFARNIIADATRDGGFPPLMLGPVDFAAMFRTQVEKQKAASDTAAPGVTVAPGAAPESD
ncbi:MAG: protein-export chaperone SecB [Rhodospirillales bacterium]